MASLSVGRILSVSIRIRSEPQTFWMGREGLLKLEPRDQMHYELVVYGRDQSGDLTGSGIGSREGDITCMVSLKAREPSNGVQPEAQAYRYSQSMQIRLKQDSAPPQVKISMGETPYITKEPKETMDFGIYSKSILEPSIRIRDWKDENGLGEGSGLGKVSYTVWKLEEDLCTQEQIQERIDASVWKPISWEEEDEIKISAGDLGISGPCYYAVLVKATDLVGNSNIYCSNGVAVDTRGSRNWISGWKERRQGRGFTGGMCRPWCGSQTVALRRNIRRPRDSRKSAGDSTEWKNQRVQGRKRSGKAQKKQ